MTARSGTRLLAAVVFGHTAVALVHGLPHLAIPVGLAAWQIAFVAVVVIALPFCGLGPVYRGRVRLGGAAVLAGGVGSAAFGTYCHFVATTPDHVSSVTGARSAPFSVTAVAISLFALATAGLGAWLLVVSS
jgi:hypothetical protein